MGVPKILGNWKVVLLSFLGATTFWFFSALGKEYSYRIKHPINFVYNSDSLVAVKPLPDFVDIDVSGGGWDLFRESFWFTEPIVFELDNPAAIRYLTRPTILPIISDQLSEYRINFLFTDTLFIDVDRKISKVVNLKIDSAQISMDADHRIISAISLTPDTARIYGPTSFIDTLGRDFFIPLDADDIDKSFDRFVKLGLPEIFEIRSDPPTVNVGFEVDQFDKLELGALVEMQNFPSDSSVFVTNPNVVIQFVVQSELREEYFAEDFKVVVDYNLIDKADSTAPAIIVFHPDHVIEVETTPDSLAITYEK
ncbi:YbbR-like domain-containing protein [Ekhidna sp.]